MNVKTLATSLLWLPLLIWYLIAFHLNHNDSFYTSVDSVYYHAAQHWLSGAALYDGTGFGFVYLPTMAAFFSPLSLLPLKTFMVIFRVVSILIFAAGLHALCRFAAPKLNQAYFIVTLCCVALAQSGFFEGQMHMIITGLIMLGFVAIGRQNWWRAAFYLALSVALKPTAIVLFLLACAVYWRLTLKLFLVTAFLLLIIFVMQSPSYVAQQYHSFVNSFHTAMQFDGENSTHWATFFGALTFYTQHYFVASTQFITRLLMAFVMLIFSFFAKQRLQTKDALIVIFTLGMCYLMLFNSRTENNDYIMVIPSIGFLLALAVHYKRFWQMSFYIGILLLMALNWNLAKLITPHNNLWLNPTLIGLFFIYFSKKVLVAMPGLEPGTPAL